MSSKAKKFISSSPFSEGETDLLKKPRNTTAKRIFIAATRMNDGKTTTSLGLFSEFRNRYNSVGFIKPIGQRFIDIHGHKIDEDSFLLDSIYDVEVPIEAMSPIAVDTTFTRRYLSNPEQNRPILLDSICRAFDRASFEKELCIIEGTGHAGVGAVFDFSNAQVAKSLNAKAIIVARGGIGRPIDEIAINKALFDKFEVEVIGAILNKVIPEKISDIREYAGRGLERLGVPLLGVLPVQNQLSAPNLSQIVQEIGGRWLNGRIQGMNERITEVVIGAMSAKSVVELLQPGVLIITPGDREDIILSAIACSGIYGKKVVSGIILTRNVPPHPKLMEMLSQTNIPVIIAKDESYAIASKINNMTIKIQPQDSDKIPIVNKMIKDNVDVDKIMNAL